MKVCTAKAKTAKANIFDFGGFVTELVEKTLDYCNPRHILILSLNWKSWLRSQALNKGNSS
jgi:hypothetical protein